VHAGGQSAEFALLVHEQWQRRGVGQWALQRLEHVARRAGLRFLIGPVQADNLPMLALMAHCGYALAPDPDEGGLVQARLDLHPLGVAGQLAQWMQTRSRRVRPLHAVH
jgi:acetyltransferase